MPVNEKDHSEQARKAFRGITPENIVRHELIGLDAEIIRSTDTKKAGTKGTIIDETKKMLRLRTDAGEKLVEKTTSEIRLVMPDGKKVDVNGKLLLGRPEERIKKKFPQRWDSVA